jgi:hypothetical protein
MNATVSAVEFKSAIAAVTKFPSAGAFGGSEMVGVQVSKGQMTLSSQGVVLSQVTLDAQGDLELVGIDERALASFASVCRKKDIVFEIDKGIATLSSGRVLKVATSVVSPHTLPDVKNVPTLEISSILAAKTAILAGVAYNDTSRPELTCVFLTTDGRAIAVDQKAFAVLSFGKTKMKNHVALPLALAKALEAGTIVYPAVEQTVIKTGRAFHCMPSPVAAQKNFPLTLVDQCAAHKAKAETVATCNGKKFVEVLADANSCLNAVARTEIELQVRNGKKGIVFEGQNGGAMFRAVVPSTMSGLAFDLSLPLERVIAATRAFSDAKEVKLAVGPNGETFVICNDEWNLFPRQIKATKK